MSHLAAQPAADAAVHDRSDGVFAQWVRIRLNGQRWAAGEAYAGMVPRAGIGIHAKPFAHYAFARGDSLLDQRFYAPLRIQGAFALGDNHFRSLFLGSERFFE